MSKAHVRPINEGRNIGRWAVDEYTIKPKENWDCTTFYDTKDEAIKACNRLKRKKQEEIPVFRLKRKLDW